MYYKVLADKFRGKFLDFFKKEVSAGNIKFYGSIDYLNDSIKYKALRDTLYDKDWVVFSKKTFKNASYVVKYLAKYTNRVAIANSRITKLEDHQVILRYKDNNDNGKTKFMTLDVLEFIRRFLLHILPKGFKKIRYYGLMGSRNRNTKLLLCKRLTQTDIIKYIRLSTDQLIEKLGLDINKCPVCGCKNFSKAPFSRSKSPPSLKKYQLNNN